MAVIVQNLQQPEKGLVCLRRVLDRLPDAESKAGCVLGMGGMMESVQDYEAAVGYYK